MLRGEVSRCPKHKPSHRRTTVKRVPERGVYDRAVIHAILDEGLICHVGFVAEGQPFVVGQPTCGLARVVRARFTGEPDAAGVQQRALACVTVTLVDGLVLARSAFHHSMNYRSVVILGRAVVVEDPDTRMEVLRALTEHLIPGRWADVRGPNVQELKKTLILEFPISEVSAKVRVGPPVDDEEDYDLNAWAGVIPLGLAASAPTADPRLSTGTPVPDYVTQYSRRRRDATSREHTVE